MNIFLMIILFAVGFILGLVFCKYFSKRGIKLNFDITGLNSSALISEEKAQRIISRYHTTTEPNAKILEGYIDKEPFLDAKLAWVSFHDLRNYMRYLEAISIKNGFLNVSQMGIRMYYGRYPNDKDELIRDFNSNRTINDSYCGRHTLVMVPTFRQGEIDFDFNPHFVEKGSPMHINKVKEIKTKANHKVQGKTTQLETNSSIIPNTSLDDFNPSNTDVNLNSFGLTPPRPNENSGAAYLPPQPPPTTV